MKKVIVCLTVLALVYVLVGCGEAKKSPEKKVTEAKIPTVSVKVTEAKAPETTPAVEAKPAVTPATAPVTPTAKTPKVPDAAPAAVTTPKTAPENK